MTKSLNLQQGRDYFQVDGFLLKHLELNKQKCSIDIHLPLTDQCVRFVCNSNQLNHLLSGLGNSRKTLLNEITKKLNQATKYKCKINVEELLKAPTFIDCFVIVGKELRSANNDFKTYSIAYMFDKERWLRSYNLFQKDKDGVYSISLSDCLRGK